MSIIECIVYWNKKNRLVNTIKSKLLVYYFHLQFEFIWELLNDIHGVLSYLLFLAGCVDHPCKFGECYVTDTSYRCQCQSGFAGTDCDEFVGSEYDNIL